MNTFNDLSPVSTCYFTGISLWHICSYTIFEKALALVWVLCQTMLVSVFFENWCELDSYQKNEETGSPLLNWLIQSGKGWDSGGGGQLVGGQVWVPQSWSIPSCRWPSRRTTPSNLKPVLTTKQTAYTCTYTQTKHMEGLCTPVIIGSDRCTDSRK